MYNPLRRRWKVEKFDRMTGAIVIERSPAPAFRYYWTRSRAVQKTNQLNRTMYQISRVHRFRTVPR